MRMPNRKITYMIGCVFNQILPPVLRDAKWFMNFWLFIVYGNKKDIYMNFRQNAYNMSKEEFAEIYHQTRNLGKRATDLNRKCINTISESIVGDSVIDVGCGNGYLVEKLKNENPDKRVCGTDIFLTEEQRAKDYYFNDFAEKLTSVKDKEFDTSICAHVLEHVWDFEEVISEIRRITARRIIIILPCEREYKYNFSLHLRFFPYLYSLTDKMQRKGDCRFVDGDIFYVEDMPSFE